MDFPVKLTLGSVFSGIGGAEEAFSGLALSIFSAEIEKSPSRVLAKRHPDVPNFGDMTNITARIKAEGYPLPDIMAGGSPCQSFSISGLRKSMDDVRGNLAFEYIRLADQVDESRRIAGLPPCVILWENVPGVLSTKDNAFGCFLAGLVGADAAIEPAGKRGRWTRAGLVRGPKRSAAWRVLDAQFFGLAQRRERVFVVASARPGFHPEQILFEPEGVRRDSPPRRETGQDVTGTLAARTRGGGGLGTDFDLAGGLVAADGRSRGAGINPGTLVPQVIGPLTSSSHPGGHNGQDDDKVFVIQERAVCENPFAGPDGIGVKEGVAYTLEARSVPQAVAYGGAKVSGSRDISTALRAHDGPAGRLDFESETFIVQPTAYDMNQMTSPTNRSNPRPGLSHALTEGAGPPTIAVALRGRDGGAAAELGDDLAFALRASSGGGDKGHVLAFNAREDTCVYGDLSGSLGSSAPQAQAIAYNFEYGLAPHGSMNGHDVAPPIVAADAKGHTAIHYGYAVRRLMPSECESLQGYPQGYTKIRGLKDGPRYKALGNSWAVPVVRWIAQRIVAHMTGMF
jgi:DNA (cytosine-5)-methyltransferase 1